MRTRRFAPVAALAASGLALGCIALAGPATAAETDAFGRTSTYPVYLNVPEGVDPAEETVAEISTITPDGNTMIYTDAAGKRIGFVDVSDPANPQGKGTIDLAELGHADDQPTSVAAVGDYVLVVIDETGGDFKHPKGRVDVVRVSDRERVTSIDLEGQPDSIAISKDGVYAAIAIENQRDEEAMNDSNTGDKGDLPQAPSGFVSVINLEGDVTSWKADKVNFVDEQGAPLKVVADAGLNTPEDIEPEYVSINSRDQLAVTLQENNGVAIIDLPSREITDVWSTGTVSASGIDTEKDGRIDQTGEIKDVPREPDAIAWVDDETLATANEGDWQGGSRGWTLFTKYGVEIWDAGNEFEQLATQYGLHNEGRAGKKGPEPEGMAVAEIGGVKYAFVASERSNFVAVYDLTDVRNPQFKQLLFTTNGPEGVLPVPSRDMLLVSSEVDDAKAGVRSSINIYQLGAGDQSQPSIVSADDENGTPIGWTALGALTADPKQANILYSATDAALGENSIYTIDAAQQPAVITESHQVLKDGKPTSYDIEGIAARADGGFWLASEGALADEKKDKPAKDNLLVEVDKDYNVVREVKLPEDVASHIGKWGLEGVSVTTNAKGEEVLYFAVQRPLWKDPAAKPLEGLEGDNTARIGQYNVKTGEFAWFGYELETTDVKGDWMGLSEVTVIDENTLAVIERDKLNGPNAAVKRVYEVTLPSADEIAAAGGKLIPVEKKLAIDVLPLLQATNGWTQEKLEGFTMAADGSLYAVTDNDGLDDATGETVFLRLGKADEVFGKGETPGTPEPSTPGEKPEPSTPSTPGTPEPSTPGEKPEPSTPGDTATPVPTKTTDAPTPSASVPAKDDKHDKGDPKGGLATTGAEDVLLLGGLAVVVTAAGALLVVRRRTA